MPATTAVKTLAQKLWDSHVVREGGDEPDLLYVDLHLVHEVTSPQAFEGLRLAERGVRRPDLTVATMDHNVPTAGLDRPLEDPISAKQIETLAGNCKEFGIRCYAMGDPGQGIVAACNMSIGAGARGGLMAPDDTPFAYLGGRPAAPTGAAWQRALEDWRSLVTDDGAAFDKYIDIDAATLLPQVSWGTNPSQTVAIDATVPDPDEFADDGLRESAKRALMYMGLKANTPMRDITVDTVFIGSCTNSRIEDLRAAAKVAEGRQGKAGVRTLVVPGTAAVKGHAEA